MVSGIVLSARDTIVSQTTPILIAHSPGVEDRWEKTDESITRGFFFLPALHRILVPPSRDQIHTLCIGSTEPQPLDHQENAPLLELNEGLNRGGRGCYPTILVCTLLVPHGVFQPKLYYITTQHRKQHARNYLPKMKRCRGWGGKRSKKRWWKYCNYLIFQEKLQTLRKLA